jgi:hypothetical protein
LQIDSIVPVVEVLVCRVAIWLLLEDIMKIGLLLYPELRRLEVLALEQTWHFLVLGLSKEIRWEVLELDLLAFL